jgi:predicted peroxiredoxin
MQLLLSKRRLLMKLGIVITQTDPETVYNTLRFASYSLKQGDSVRIFLSGKGVDIEKIEDPQFDVKGQAQEVLDAGGEFLACGTCLQLRKSGGSQICPISTLKDHYEVVRDSDKLITV